MLNALRSLQIPAVTLLIALLVSAPSASVAQGADAPALPTAPATSDQTPGAPAAPLALDTPTASQDAGVPQTGAASLSEHDQSAADGTAGLTSDVTDSAPVEAQTDAGAAVQPDQTGSENAPVVASGAPLADQITDEAETEAEQSVTAPYFDAVRPLLPDALQDETDRVQSAADTSARFLRDGGPSIWAIAALSIITVAVILWKIWRLALIGAWSKGRARKAVAAYEAGTADVALTTVAGRRGLRSKVVSAALVARQTRTDDLAREDTARVAKNELADAATGLRALELIATIAPLLGLLGTVLGMIAAFQALQDSGSRADPALLAGGIWEALLTTAAGMAVAIPASAALAWFEAVIDRMRRDVEDAVTRIFVADRPIPLTRGSDISDLQTQDQIEPAAAAE